MFLVVRRTSVFWTVHGQTSRSTLSQLLPGAETESRRWLTIGSSVWLLTIIVLQRSFSVGPSTDKALLGTLRPLTNFLTRLCLGLEIQVPGSEQRGRTTQ